MKRYPHCMCLDVLNIGPFGGALITGAAPVGLAISTFSSFYLDQVRQIQQQLKPGILLSTYEMIRNPQKREEKFGCLIRVEKAPNVSHLNGDSEPKP